MNNDNQQRLMEFLKTAFDPDGTIHFLAVSAQEPDSADRGLPGHLKVRIALTFQDGFSVDPYFDGTDICVVMTPKSITFANQDEWADGPPAMEGSPIELALKWVSELAPPFWISLEAQKAANKTTSEGNTFNPPTSDADFNSWF